MQFLIDKSPADVTRKTASPIVMGQLLTPLTRYADWGGAYAIDNGAFSGFPAAAFAKLLDRQTADMDRCLFVTCPDIVGSGRRTLEVWQYRRRFFPGKWINKAALVAQDGMEDLLICWENVHALFVGGNDPWKESAAAADLIKTAKTLGLWVHAGRVNTPRRFDHFAALGVDSCDGSGVAMYDHMLETIERRNEPSPGLFDTELATHNWRPVVGTGGCFFWRKAMTETLAQELESAIGVTNTHLKMIVAGELTPFSGILRVQYLMSFRRRLVDECGYDLQRADALIDWQSIGIWSKLMAETVPATHISGEILNTQSQRICGVCLRVDGSPPAQWQQVGDEIACSPQCASALDLIEGEIP